MNIFFLFQCPVEAAEALCLAHMKMIVESVQLLYTAHHLHGADFASHPADLKVYRKTHSGHPMALWVASSVPNYRWLHAHATALAARYARLWPGKTHASSLHLPWLATPPATLPHDKHHLHDNLPLTSLATVHPPDGCIGAPLCFGQDAAVVAACTVVTPDGRDLTGSPRQVLLRAQADGVQAADDVRAGAPAGGGAAQDNRKVEAPAAANAQQVGAPY